MCLGATKNQEECARIFKERRQHMLSTNELLKYLLWMRLYSELYPNKYLCIIHDKIDQKKIAIAKVGAKDTYNAWQFY